MLRLVQDGQSAYTEFPFTVEIDDSANIKIPTKMMEF